jgi:hypothetical protein
MGLTTMIELKREAIRGRFKYSCDLSPLGGRELGFRWTYIPHCDLSPEEANRPPWVNGKLIGGDRRAGFAFFPSERDAVTWKLILS